MGKLNQPGKSIKLSNVSIVRMKKGGKRFEIACYPNKVMDYRSGVEKDIDSVIQIEAIYLNTARGDVASSEELLKAFGTQNIREIIEIVLKEGVLQIGEKERNQQAQLLFKDCCNLVSQSTVDPATQRPYTQTMIEKVLQDLHFNPNPNKNAKQLSLDAIKLIQSSEDSIKLSRVRIRVRISTSLQVAKQIKTQMMDLIFKIDEEPDWSSPVFEMVSAW